MMCLYLEYRSTLKNLIGSALILSANTYVVFHSDPTIFVLGFWNVRILFFVFRIQVCLKQDDIEFTKEKFRFILALISRHFISLSRYFRLLTVMHQMKEKGNSIKKSRNKFFAISLIFLNIQEIKFKCWIFMIFLTNVFLFGIFSFIM